MIDVWMIFTMTIPLFEIMGHTYSESLKRQLSMCESPSNPSASVSAQNSVSNPGPIIAGESKRSRGSPCWSDVERKKKMR